MRLARKIFSALIVLGLIGIFGGTTAFAADFRADQTVNVTQDVSGDLYIGSGNATVNNKVDGDLLVGAGNVTVNGEVTGDVAVGAGTVSLSGKVGDDVRIGGGTVEIKSEVGGDVVVGAGQVQIAKSATIKGDLLVGAGTVTVNGNVGGNIHAWAGTIILNSVVGGSVSGHFSQEVQIEKDAYIKGDLNYYSPKEAEIASGAKIDGQTTHTPWQPEKFNFRGLSVGLIWSFLGFLALGLILIALWPKKSEEAQKMVQTKFLVSLGVGFLTLVAVPIVVLILLVSLIGFPVAGILGMLYAILLMLAGLVTSLWLGRIILKDASIYLAFFVGFLILGVIGWIPVVGWIVKFVAVLVGLGVLVLMLIEGFRRTKQV